MDNREKITGMVWWEGLVKEHRDCGVQQRWDLMLLCKNAEIKLHFELYPWMIMAEVHRTGLVSLPSGLLVPNTQICEIEFLMSAAT